MPFASQPSEKCFACNKTVYLTEKAVVEEKTDKRVFHKTCIRCLTCNKVLGVGQYSSMDGKFWCKPHFKQLFATKGNYDEAFGKEKVTSKWDANQTSPSPSSGFIPKVEESKQEAKQTSEATLSKFRAFREEGDSNKCVSCAKTVYLAEKMLIEDKNDKKLFHKTCFKCSVCGMILDLRNYGSLGGKIYCKQHLKEQSGSTLTSSSGSTGSSYVSAPTSFIPSTSEEKKENKSQTPENIASKFRSQETEKCKSCGKSVYATEKVTLPGLNQQQQSIYHKTCLKCSICNKSLDVSSYHSANGALYCSVHLKQYAKPEQAKGEGSYFVSPLASTDNNYVAGPPGTDDIRRDDDDVRSSSDRENRNSDYDRDDDRNDRSEDRNDRYEDRSENSEKEEREVEREPEPEREKERESDSESRYSNEGRSSPAIERRDSARSSPSIERNSDRERTSSFSRDRSSSYSRNEGNEDDDRKKKEEERQRKREERQRAQEEEERKEEEERERRKKERERRLLESSEGGEVSSSYSPTTSSGSDDREREREERRKKREEERKREEEERERQEEKRKREREERRRQQDEEAKRELEEQERKAEERRRKLEELKSNS